MSTALPVKSVRPSSDAVEVGLAVSVGLALSVGVALSVGSGDWDSVSVGVGVDVPSPSATVTVAAFGTVSVGVHTVFVPIAFTVYAPGVRVSSPAAVSFSVPFMSDSTMSPPLGIAGFSRGPVIAMSAVCAPAAFSVPVGWTELAGRSMMFGFFDAACVNFHTTSISSPTFAVAGTVISTLVVPLTGSSPTPAGGTHRVANDTSAAWAGPAARPSTTPAPASTSAAPAAPALLGPSAGVTLLRMFTGIPLWWESSDSSGCRRAVRRAGHRPRPDPRPG